MITDVGALNKRIAIQKKAVAQSGIGWQSADWETIFERWAAMKDVSGREYFAAAAVQAENITLFTIRWTDGIDTSMRIVYKGRPFAIVQISRARYRGDYMEIRARETAQEGERAAETGGA